jgi:hypothetical protein
MLSRRDPLETLNALRDEFIQEAKNAPKLFKDLAKVEQYIAESYKTRSLLELIQNADDAESTAFGVHRLKEGLVVANNGRFFTVEDVEALCRSGSSHKYRGGNTIGYRGIGFKSVVNLAKRIYVFSGDYSFFFDRDFTRRALPGISEVPLVRVPHPYVEGKDDKLWKEINKIKSEHNYNTMFVFQELNERMVDLEFLEFDRSSLLFLNNIRQVCFDLEGVNRFIRVEKVPQKKSYLVRIIEADKVDEWEILRAKDDPKDMVAFKRFGDCIVPALPEESVIHSFTPTIEFAGAYIKINGDYSTDPSRKNVDMDDFSRKSFDNAVSTIVDHVEEVLCGKIVKRGFFSPFVNVVSKEGGKFKALLFKELSSRMSGRILSKFNGQRVTFSSLRLKPDWLNYEDYTNLCRGDLAYLSKELVVLYPELPQFLEQLGVKRLKLEEILAKVNQSKLSVTGAAQIFAKVVNQFVYDLTGEKLGLMKSLKLFPVGNKFVTCQEVASCERLDKDFFRYVCDNVNSSDLRQVFSRLGMAVDLAKLKNTSSVEDTLLTGAENQTTAGKDQVTADGTFSAESKSKFKATPEIKKWRSAEKNAEEYIKALAGVLSVVDVSKANMGYDLEVLFNDRRRAYVEVKSVSSFSEPIKITNNEYSSAHSYGDAYYLALVINDEPFQIKVIPDPINTLSFQKQYERWSWVCESYKEQLRDVDEIIK